MQQIKITFAEVKPYWWIIVGVPLAVLIIAQILYPQDRLLPRTLIEGVPVGWQTKQATIQKLNKRNRAATIDLTTTGQTQPHSSAKFGDFGLTVSHKEQVNAHNYPFLMRLVPGSILWLNPDSISPKYNRNDKKLDEFIARKFGKDCFFEPKDASVAVKDNKLISTSAQEGGQCNRSKVKQQFNQTLPVLGEKLAIKIEVDPVAPKVTTAIAKQTKALLEKTTAKGVVLTVNSKDTIIPQKTIYKWLSVTPDKKTLKISINPKRSSDYLTKKVVPEVEKKPDTIHITMRNFTETSRSPGSNGRKLNLRATRQSIVDTLIGKTNKATAKTQAAPAIKHITYTYTKDKTGITALMHNFDEKEKGQFGVSLIELNGSGAAQHNGDKVFTAASTYKLFVAYGTLKKVEQGKWKWSNNIHGGRNLATCFDDMIVKSDNPCAETLLRKLGFSALTNQLRDLGLKRSGFMGSGPEATANDLSLFLTKLQRGDMPLKASSRERLLGAMKRNIYRQGIPSGASGKVADKVGFLNGLLHDAAIVYSPKGTYVLVIMSNGSSWSKIAELTREIEKLR